MASPLPWEGQGSNEGALPLRACSVVSSKKFLFLCNSIVPSGGQPSPRHAPTSLPGREDWDGVVGRGAGSGRSRLGRSGEKASGFSPALLSALALALASVPSSFPSPTLPLSRFFPTTLSLPLNLSCSRLRLCSSLSWVLSHFHFPWLSPSLPRSVSLFLSFSALLTPPGVPVSPPNSPALSCLRASFLQASPQVVPPAPQPALPPSVLPQGLTIPCPGPPCAPHFRLSPSKGRSLSERMSELQCKGPDTD